MALIMQTEQASDYIGDELTLFADAVNWKNYWSNTLEPLVGDKVLEVGAGIGSNTALLRRRNQNWTALEPDQTQANKIENSYPNDDKLEIVCGFLSDISAEKQYDTLIYIDVLEHIEDDLAEVKAAMMRLKTGGKLIVLSPAHQRFFSPFDKAVGHFRRYNKAMLRGLTPSNAAIEKLFYMDSVGCLASYANAVLLEASMPTKRQIWLWDKFMVPISKVLDVLFNYSVGKTVIAVWKKTT